MKKLYTYFLAIYFCLSMPIYFIATPNSLEKIAQAAAIALPEKFVNALPESTQRSIECWKTSENPLACLALQRDLERAERCMHPSKERLASIEELAFKCPSCEKKRKKTDTQL